MTTVSHRESLVGRWLSRSKVETGESKNPDVLHVRRRDFISFAGLACAGFALDPTRALWMPKPIRQLPLVFGRWPGTACRVSVSMYGGARVRWISRLEELAQCGLGVGDRVMVPAVDDQNVGYITKIDIISQPVGYGY